MSYDRKRDGVTRVPYPPTMAGGPSLSRSGAWTALARGPEAVPVHCARVAIKVASILLVLFGMLSCLPPDFEIATDENKPVRIERPLLTVSPDVVHRLSGCPPPALELDVGTALINEDADRIFSAWLVNYTVGQGGRPDATSTTGPRTFVFNPCTNPKVLTGSAINTVELVVLDRAPASFDTADDVKVIVDPDTTTANVVWFIAVEDLSCCGGQQ